MGEPGCESLRPTPLASSIRPQGLYDSIKDASVLGVPIYITETGLADKDGKNRRYMIEGHCGAIVRAIKVRSLSCVLLLFRFNTLFSPLLSTSTPFLSPFSTPFPFRLIPPLDSFPFPRLAGRL